METITIESEAFNIIIERIESIENYVKQSNYDKEDLDSSGILLDTNQVCELLSICDRTLWKLRKNNLIAYTFQGKKCIYQLAEIERIITNQVISCDVKSIPELRSKYFTLIK